VRPRFGPQAASNDISSGSSRIGVLYILFIWTLLPPLIALIEGLLYLNSDDATFGRRYADGSVLGIVG
jgi:hypothetical protein